MIYSTRIINSSPWKGILASKNQMCNPKIFFPPLKPIITALWGFLDLFPDPPGGGESNSSSSLMRCSIRSSSSWRRRLFRSVCRFSSYPSLMRGIPFTRLNGLEHPIRGNFDLQGWSGPGSDCFLSLGTGAGSDRIPCYSCFSFDFRQDESSSLMLAINVPSKFDAKGMVPLMKNVG